MRMPCPGEEAAEVCVAWIALMNRTCWRWLLLGAIVGRVVGLNLID